MEDQAEQLRKAVLVIKRLQGKLHEYEVKENEQVAILGMACRLPGKSNTLTKYWNMLINGEECIGKIPADRWDADKYFDKNPEAPGKYNTVYGSFLDDVKGFDNNFFDISDAEAKAMDPHHRLLLTVMWEALQNAYLPPSELMGKNVGIFLGMSSDKCDYLFKFNENLTQVGPLTGICNTLNGASGRLSYILNSHGPSQTVDSGSSSSLVAIYPAVQSLLSHDCDIAIVGGVSLLLSPLVYIVLAKMGILSSDGRTHGLDQDASGLGRGEGCGVIVLKRLSDAHNHSDKVLAVIKGAAINHNGMTKSLSSPSQLGQEDLMKRALHKAKVNASDISYIEVNATATKIGDAFELEAIKRVYGEGRTKECYLASANTHFGHIDAATGIAGLIKTVLQLNHKKITAQLGFKNLNKNVDFSNTKFRVPKEVIHWKTEDDQLRTAAVSAYGWSGHNAHVILEESLNVQVANSLEEGPYLLPISAKNEGYLRDLLEAYEKYLPEHPNELSHISKLASNGRDHYKYRLAFLGKDVNELVEQIKNKREAIGVVVHPLKNLVFQFPDADYDLVRHPKTNEIAEKIKTKTGIDILAESCDSKTQAFKNFAARYILASLWSSWVNKPHGIWTSQTSESGEMAYFGEMTVEAMVDDLVAKGKFEYPKKEKIGGVKAFSGDKKADDMEILVMDREGIKNERVKSLLRDLYNAGNKINWSNIYSGRSYPGMIELPKHPYHQKTFWI